MSERVDEVRGDIAALRSELLATGLRLEQAIATQLDNRIKPLEKRLDDLVGAMHAADKATHAIDKRIETVKSDLIAWSFVFWVGAVGAIAVLAGVLGR